MAGGFSGGIFSHLKNVELESRNVAFLVLQYYSHSSLK